METDDLISALAADDMPPARPHLAMRVALGGLVSVCLMALFWGARPDWVQAVQGLTVIVKQALPLAVAIWLALLLRAQPGQRRPLWPLAGLAALAGVGWAFSALSGGDVAGNSLWQCLLSIPALALPIGIALFSGLRHRVEPEAARTGLIAGLLAGAAGAAIYALHCDEDAPAFFLIWYGSAILACGLLGRAAGRRLFGV